MGEKSIDQIKQEYSAKAVEAMNEWDARVAEIREMRSPDGDAYYLGRLDDTQRANLLREQKSETAAAERQRLVRELREEHGRYARDVEERAALLKKELFAIESPDSAALLARLATASETELGSMLDIAAETNNGDLSRAAFATAHRRDIPELRLRYLGLNPEAADLYAELSEAPSPEAVERQARDIEQMIPPASPDQLAAPPRVNS